MMRGLTIINQQYPPEVAATGQIFRVMAEFLQQSGFAVTVATGTPYYPGLKGKCPKREVMGGVSVRRLWNTTLPKRSFLGKLFNLLTFEISLLFYCVFRINKRETVLVATAPPMAVLCAAIGKKLRGYRVVMTVQDLYPDVLAASGMSDPSGLSYRILFRLMRGSMRACDAVIAISTDMRRHLEDVYGLKDVRLIPNLFPEDIKRLAPPEDALVVQYSGNFGVAHEYETLLDAIRLLRDEPGICFQITGAGSNYDKLRAACEAEGLGNASFEGYAPLDRLEAHLARASASVVVLSAAFQSVLLPSKYYGILASGRAVLLISGCESDIRRDIEQESVGLWFDHGESARFAEALRHPEMFDEMGVRARALYEEKYEKRVVLEAYRDLLGEVTP